jgi:hypothetical protein
MSPNDRDDDLRRALRDAVSDVHPTPALDDIGSRTDKVIPMAGQNKRWFLPTLTVAAVMALVVGGAFWMTREDNPAGGPSTTPTQGQSPTNSPSPTAEPELTARAVPVYFVGDAARGPRLFREFQRQQVCAGTDCLLEASTVTALTGAPLDGDYSAPWPDDTGLGDVSYDGDVLTIDLSGDVHDRPSGMDAETAELAIQQLIFSAQAGLGEGRVPVQLLIDGSHTDQVLGVPASEPLAAADPLDVQAPVQIDSPTEGESVSSPVEVTGRAATFEANVVWEVMKGDNVVEQGFTTAQECCTLAPYSFTVDLEPGTYTLVTHDTDESGEGLPVNQDTKEITVK